MSSSDQRHRVFAPRITTGEVSLLPPPSGGAMGGGNLPPMGSDPGGEVVVFSPAPWGGSRWGGWGGSEIVAPQAKIFTIGGPKTSFLH